jgi:hypothetical protein
VKNLSTRLLRLCLLIAIAALVGCSPNPGGLAQQAGGAAEASATAATGGVTPEESAAAPTPTATNSPSKTPTAAPTDTPTITPTATPDLIEPGLYGAAGCDSRHTPGGTLKFCVESVTVLPNHNMQFVVSWQFSDIPQGMTIRKRSDKGNKNMYLVDEQGKTYGHIAGGGAAYRDRNVVPGKPMLGWFEFPAAPPGVRSFEFHDADQDLVIKNLRLINRIIVDADYELANYPLRLTYRLAQWEPQKQEDGSLALVHKESPDCRIQDKPSGEPQGKLKNQVKLGDVTYDIYGYLDQGNDLGFREYVAVDSFPGLDPGIRPFLLVRIPLQRSQECILWAGDVLATLAGKAPTP